MVNKNQVDSSLFGYPVSFYINKAEFPWVIYALCMFILYVATFWFNLNYLSTLVPISFVGSVITVAAATYFYGIKTQLSLGACLTLGAIIGLLLGFISSLLALFRFWHIWLFFNVITESLISIVLGLLVALLTILLFRLPWLKKFHGAVDN
ncbi:MAG: hypothetical protein V1712_02105 [Patescibacteria group bacterium]